jgi:uroporphyrinogen-III decarboxylase
MPASDVTLIDVPVSALEQRRERLAKARRGEPTDRCPVMVDVSDLSYADIRGISVDEYLTDPVLHAEAQIEGQKWVMENLRTDLCGIGVGPRQGAFPSLFGAPMVRSDGNRTWVKPCIDEDSDLDALAALDIERTGIEAVNTEWKQLYRRIAPRYGVRFRNGEVFHPLADQGPPLVGAMEDPLTVAVDLMGADRFFMACADSPGFVNDLIGVLTDMMLTVVRKNEAQADYSGEVFVSSDYAPMLSPDMYVRFALPALRRVKETINGPMRLHHCDVPGHLVEIILDELQPEILNGFKARADLAGAMTLMAQKVGDRAYMEPYLDGTAMLHQGEQEIYHDALTVIQIFSERGCRFHLGAMSADGHPMERLCDLNGVMRASVDYAAGTRLPDLT